MKEIDLSVEAKEASFYLLHHGVVSFPTETVMGLAVVYNDYDAYMLLNKIKRRPEDKPYTLMLGSVEEIKKYSYINEKVQKIIDAFMDGTIYDIQMDSSDCLISAGNDDIQLTWMDVKVDGEVITPRNGKAVEINALWYNALMIYVTIQEKFGNNVNDIKSIACRAKMSFTDTFWNEKEGDLYDYIKPDGTPDFSFRPNQIFATYLPFDLLERTKEKQVVDAVFARLYTSSQRWRKRCNVAGN